MSEKYTLGADVDLDAEEIHEPDGTRLTEARAEELAAETLPTVRGRPSLTGTGRHSPRESFRLSAAGRELPKSLLDWVRVQAAAEHVKPTAWIRSLIESNRAGGSDLEERVSVLETLLATLVESARTKRPSPAKPVPLGDRTRHATAKPALPSRLSVAGWSRRH